jgi:hypothetical protein
MHISLNNTKLVVSCIVLIGDAALYLLIKLEILSCFLTSMILMHQFIECDALRLDAGRVNRITGLTILSYLCLRIKPHQLRENPTTKKKFTISAHCELNFYP